MKDTVKMILPHIFVTILIVGAFVCIVICVCSFQEANNPGSDKYWIQRCKSNLSIERSRAICVLSAQRPYTQEVRDVLHNALSDSDELVRQQAVLSLGYKQIMKGSPIRALGQ